MMDFEVIGARVEQDRQTQARLDAWYEQDGRGLSDHPMHQLYTGLASKYRSQQESRS
jgi:hypothetical protein